MSYKLTYETLKLDISILENYRYGILLNTVLKDVDIPIHVILKY